MPALVICAARASSTKPQRDAQRLRRDHVPELLPDREAETGRRLPLGELHRLDGAAPDFAEKRAGIDRIGDTDGHDGRQVDAEEDRHAEIEEHQQAEQRSNL